MNIVGARLPTDYLRRSTFATGQMASVFELRSQELFDSPFPGQGVIRHVEGDGQFHVIRKIHQLSHPFKQSSPNAGLCRKFNFAALGAGLCLSTVHLLPTGHIVLLWRPRMHFYSVPHACFARCSAQTDCAFRSSRRNFDEKHPRLKRLKPITEKRKRKLNRT